MKPALSSKEIFFSSVVFYVLVVLLSLKLATSIPWLGVGLQVEPVSGEIYVASVDENSPAFNIVLPGEQLIAIHNAINAVRLSKELIQGTPYNFNIYKEFNYFFSLQSQVGSILSSNKIFLENDSNVLFEVTPNNTRPVSSLPLMFWLQLLIGGGIFFVSMSVLAFASNRLEAVNIFFSLAGVSFLILSGVVAVYTSREIALDGSVFYLLSIVQYYSSLLFVLFFVSVFCFYPMKVKQAKVWVLGLFGLSVFSLLHLMQVFEFLFFSVYLLFYIIGAIGVFFIILQYKHTRGFIVERASLRWLVYALITGDVLFFIISIIPLIASFELIYKQFFYWIALLCVYVGVALGLKKYKLFKLELWALYSWVWMFGGLVVLGLAVLLMTVFNVNSVVALLFSILAVGWLYFPLRHWLWENYAFGFNRAHYQERLPELLEIILSPKAVRSTKEQWEFLLRQVFEPVLVMHDIDDADEITIKESGAVLHVPEFEGIPALGLAGVEHGSRLFNVNDVSFLNSMMTLFKNAQVFKGEYERGVHEERIRIARDLHDDVAARLLTLIHKSEGTPQEPLAREALVTLRESINSLGGQKDQSLDELLRELQVDIKFRLAVANIKLYWDQDRRLYKKTLSSRQATNFKRVCQELVSNILKHANASSVRVEAGFVADLFSLSICDDGNTKLMKDWVNGRGVNNIRTRIKESGGTVRWNQRIEDELLVGTCVDIAIPI
ncbi:hypothetical protein MNBD_GAMMA23-1848 [hydrothermal vent metagenome]|uniref:histidine kinase n=1 Tax=hydrothermal vent metagenome TaxID=652676 RepID=A0A3B1A0U9_9ZZZZ